MQIITLFASLILAVVVSASPVTDTPTPATLTTTALSGSESFSIGTIRPTGTGASSSVFPLVTDPAASPVVEPGRLNVTAPLNVTSTQYVHCSGWDMPNDFFHDIGEAIKLMIKGCEGDIFWIGPGQAYRWWYGNAQIYYCNFAPDIIYLNCGPESYNDAMRNVDGRCGAGGGGWFEYGEDNDYWYSIGRDPMMVNGDPVFECNKHWGPP